jgi:hypothetical protein
VRLSGRLIHGADGSSHFQRYGPTDACYLLSVPRPELNALLLDAAEVTDAPYM